MKHNLFEHRNALPGPDDTLRVELPNGITVLARANFNSSSVVISGYLGCGSLFDPLDKLGLSHYTALALMRGTQNRSFQEIFNDLESSGASLGFGASVHNVSFGGRALAEDLPLLLGTLSDCLRNPVFPGEYVERLRAQITASLAIRAQDTNDMASINFENILYPNHPYGRPEDGFVETIQAISRDDLVSFHHDYYGPDKMTLVIVGGLEPQKAVDAVRDTLGDWRNEDQISLPTLPDVSPLTETVRKHVAIVGKSQSDLVMGTLGPRRNSEDYLPASLGNNVLGQFGMMGRIGDVVREQAGLAYYASTSLNGWIVSGSWEVSAGVNPSNLQQAIDLIIQELERFTREPVSMEELADSQANFIGRLPLSLESNAGVAGALLNLERFDLGLDYYQRYPDLVRQVTPDQVLEIARRYIDISRLAIVSAGTEPGQFSRTSMVKLRTGVDILEIKRLIELDPSIQKRFFQRVFTPRELAESGDMIASLAGRFAAKEAVSKALGTGIGQVGWQEIEVLRGSSGEPFLTLHGRARVLADRLGLTIWSVSISHSAQYAVAMVVALAEANTDPDPVQLSVYENFIDQ